MVAADMEQTQVHVVAQVAKTEAGQRARHSQGSRFQGHSSPTPSPDRHHRNHHHQKKRMSRHTQDWLAVVVGLVEDWDEWHQAQTAVKELWVALTAEQAQHR